MSYNTAISAEYKKWIIKLLIDGKPCFTLWGYDTTKFNDDNNLLVDEQKNMLVFKSITPLMNHVKTTNNVFDKKATRAWVKKLKLPVRSHSTHNLDLLKSKSLLINERQDFADVINAWDIADDYAHCTENEKMLSVCQSPQLKNLFQYYCNLYLWTKDKKMISSNEKKMKPIKIISLLNKLSDLFDENIIIIK